MTVNDFDYQLPENLIAQTPLDCRDHSRLLVLHRNSGEVEHKHFYELTQVPRPSGYLVPVQNFLLDFGKKIGGNVGASLGRGLLSTLFKL